MIINCIIVDDEPLALDLLKSYIDRTPFLNLITKCSSAVEALTVIEKETVDLIFLDIQMPNLSGIDFSKMIVNTKPKIIFTTAFAEFALESYKVNAIDYLLKPINYTEFFLAANKAKSRILPQVINNLVEPQKANEDYIFIKSDYKLIKIEFNDLIYVEGLKDYLKFYTINSEEPILSLKSLKSLELELPSNQFMRIHRSFIVNLKKVNKVERNRIIYGKKYLPISEKYKEQFQKYINSKL